jgi:uncharacterized protein YciI
MKQLQWFVCLAFCLSALLAQAPPQPEKKYEMTTYILGLLHRGPNWSPGVTEETKKIQAGHMANIQKMAATGKLIVAGPIADNSNLRGIFIFANTTKEEAKAMAEADPAIQSGRLTLELYSWFAAKGIKVDQ